MKVAFFSETGNNQKYPRDFPNARTEVAWCLALDAPMCHLQHLPNERFDLGIVIIPKNNPIVDLNHIRTICDNVAVMQEGPHWFFQDYTVEQQFHYYNTLVDADLVYCHNESDVNYFLGLGCKDVRVMRSLMITDGFNRREFGWNDSVMIGGNFVSWYGGFDSYIVAREIGNSIWAPSMGRKQDQENLIEDINYLNYMNWREWITTLGQFNIGVHLMRTHAAGTFAMNCGYLGIPCVGYGELDTQSNIHPNLTVEQGDLESAVKLVNRLRDDKDFYNEQSKLAKENYEKHHSEKVVNAYLTNFFNSL